MTGESMADPVEPLVSQIVVDKGDEVTLSCSYKGFSGSVYRVYWYRQYLKSNPEYLLFITPSGSKSRPIPPRLDVTINQNIKQVDLIISSAAVSDSAQYYCAVQPTVEGDSMADLIKLLFTDKAFDEGHNVTLSCSYSNAVTYLHWYREYPKSKPVFHLYISPFGGRSDSIPPRLNATVRNEHMDLIISSAAVSDSALYYCALEPTVTGNSTTLYKILYTVLFY
ncbi:hypothetical protein C0J45_5547 [Silurus meridionalis]|nr:hypothetical protein C0J45_5547 [Silurus meridionalis]